MSASKYNIVRLKRLLAMLKENRYPNYPRFLAEMRKRDAAGAYQLSARTLQRDIAFLKTEYGAPIRYDHTRRGYYLTNPGWSVDIPLLEDREMRAAVLGARLAENIMPEPVRGEVREAVDSLLAENETGMDDKAALLSLVAMGSRAAVRPEVFRVIFEAWQAHRCVKITYHPVSEGVSERFIEPHALVFFEGNWYLKAVMVPDAGEEPKGPRRVPTLALHRIRTAEMTKRTFEPDPKIVEAVNRREIFDFPQVRDIRLRLGAQAIRFIGEQFDFEEEAREGETHIVRIKSAAAYRLVNYILAEGGDAKLLNHPELKEEVIRRAKRCIAAQEEP